ncbi:hypothetical protein AAC387_Pa07g3734 [Persea americana]
MINEPPSYFPEYSLIVARLKITIASYEEAQSRTPTRYSELRTFCPIRTLHADSFQTLINSFLRVLLKFQKVLCTNLGLFIDPLQPQKNHLSYVTLLSIEHSSTRDFVGLSCKGDCAEDILFFLLLSNTLKGRSRWVSSKHVEGERRVAGNFFTVL